MKEKKTKKSCDLLSNLYLWTIGNNTHWVYLCICRVVIYFQICIFEPLETTQRISTDDGNMLWFTFKFVSLNHWKQRDGEVHHVQPCCDLLSNLYLWTIGNNRLTKQSPQILVVIYFQICIFEPLETTEQTNAPSSIMLWFTFKFVSLNHWKQLDFDTQPNIHWLWFTFKFVSLNHWKQQKFHRVALTYVVIYFQICIFEPLETT